jgi:hypothetical protein
MTALRVAVCDYCAAGTAPSIDLNDILDQRSHALPRRSSPVVTTVSKVM